MKEERITKSDIVDEIYDKIDLSKNDISAVTDCLLLILKEKMIEKKSIELRGFGSFDIVLRKGRENARNPLTGAKVSVPDRHTVKF